MATQDPNKSTGTALKEREKAERPRLWKVLFHNDDFTTQEFVVEVLTRFFGHDRTSATRVMLLVHHTGTGIAGVYTREVAETRLRKATDYARDEQHPLLITMEPE